MKRYIANYHTVIAIAMIVFINLGYNPKTDAITWERPFTPGFVAVPDHVDLVEFEVESFTGGPVTQFITIARCGSIWSTFQGPCGLYQWELDASEVLGTFPAYLRNRVGRLDAEPVHWSQYSRVQWTATGNTGGLINGDWSDNAMSVRVIPVSGNAARNAAPGSYVLEFKPLWSTYGPGDPLWEWVADFNSPTRIKMNADLVWAESSIFDGYTPNLLDSNWAP